MRTLIRIATIATLAAPAAAMAHTGVMPHEHAGFLAGFGHPLGGIDHLAAMIAVGLWAASLGGRALWAVPAAFVTVLAGGAVLGAAGIGLPAVEPLIALSVIVLGLATAFRVQVPTVAAMALVGVFAIFHGHAHGAEMPAMADGLRYGAGFLLATALLHGVGIGAGLIAGTNRFAWVPSASGGAIAALGAILLVAG